MAKLYLIAVPHDGPLVPTFQKLPFGLTHAVVETLDFDDARAMDGPEFDALMDRIAESLTDLEQKKPRRSRPSAPAPAAGDDLDGLFAGPDAP